MDVGCLILQMQQALLDRATLQRRLKQLEGFIIRGGSSGPVSCHPIVSCSSLPFRPCRHENTLCSLSPLNMVTARWEAA